MKEDNDNEGPVEDHDNAFAGSGFDAAKWSHDDLPPPVDASDDDWEPPVEAPIDDDGDDAFVEPTLGEVETLPQALETLPQASETQPQASEAQPQPVDADTASPSTGTAPEARTEPVAAASTEPGSTTPPAPEAAAPAADYPTFELPKPAAASEPDDAPRRHGGRVVPHDLAAERSVLGALLLSPDRLVEVSEICRPDDFYDRRNRVLYEVMLSLDEASQLVDGVTLISTLRATQKLGEIGGATYLAQITTSVSTSAHVKHHASLVAHTAKLRNLIEASNGIITRAFETPPEAEQVQTLFDESEAAIFGIAAKGETRGATEVASILDEVFHGIEAQRDRGEFTGIPSGFYELDDMLGGFNPGEMTVIAARPAMGKTAFVLNIMDHAVSNRADCLGYNPSVLFFSLEMGRASIVQRMLVARAGVESHRLRSGRLHDREYADLVEAAGVLKGARLFIDDTPGLSIMALRSRARRLKAEHGLDMIVIDYLQLLSAKAESRQQEISMISRSLKELSRELEVPLLTLAQLSRSVESRENKRPQLSDLRESGSIEQDADVVMMLFREEYYAPTDENKGKAEAIVVKHRNGATGDVPLQFQGSMLRFSNREPSMAETVQGL